MKNTFLVFLIAMVTACGQTNSNKENNLDNKDSMNIVQNAYKNVAFYQERINYQATIYSSACAFELYVNDLPVYKHISGIGLSTTIPINTKILESGKQTVKIKIIPISSENKVGEKISSSAKLELNIVGVRYREKGMDKIHEAKDWKLSQQDIVAIIEKDKDDIEFAEFEDTFEAKVPYKLEGWKNSKKLTKLNSEDLLKKVVSFYNSFGSTMKNNKNGMINQIKVKEEEVAQSLFFTAEDSKQQWMAYSQSIDNKTFKIEPLENYKLLFYGNGRIVAPERIDFYSYGESPLRGKLTENGEKYIDNFPLLLHIPKNSNKLEVIR